MMLGKDGSNLETDRMTGSGALPSETLLAVGDAVTEVMEDREVLCRLPEEPLLSVIKGRILERKN